ncbi:hypothetical protein HNV08_00770 [Winogradskyella eckloniae]|uniref:hypothetical protein n=1 Tax=Winogradskyella eckloniae TaxID=1089306 RepID=UPI0015642820|nr:hypothetical protein [Winogradskyella eckloniae]NRD18562.1 hypothetical protein [Winogradskyella eckloniae]
MNSKILTFPLRLTVIILTFGALFKIMHWPYAAQLMLIGSVSIGLLYSIRFLKKADKSRLDYVKLSLILLWVFSYLVKAFHIIYLPYIFEILLVILFIYWFSIEGISYFKNRKYRKNLFFKTLYFLLIAMTIFALFFGIIFKIQHWPYGALLFTSGILLLSILLIYDYFIIDRSHK